MGLSTSVLLFLVLYQLTLGGAENYNQNIYTWFQIGHVNASVGFMVDRLTAMMRVMGVFGDRSVDVYTIGHMRDDPGYTRFFSYISLFTFSMFMLVMSNNFMQLFFGWEAVGLVSYLLIGFWYKRPTAIFANLKAFMVNRVGDFGFLLGIAAVLTFLHTLDYATAFSAAPTLIGQHVQITANTQWDAATVICILLFIGAMGKSAQVPLHVWLPDAMEGPTPISALIHAATMVTAGVFMVARLAPIYNLSPTAMSVVAVTGAATMVLGATIALTQTDIKRVVAYSTFVAGSLALAGFPLTAGFFSKDDILVSAWSSGTLGQVLALFGLVTALLTAFYSFRLVFVTFWGTSRVAPHHAEHLHEPSQTITTPLIILAFLSILTGYLGIPSFLEPVFSTGTEAAVHHGSAGLAIMIAATAMGLLGIAAAYYVYVVNPGLPERLVQLW